MIPLRHFTVPLSTLFFICSFLSVANCNQISEDSSIYDILNLYGLPMGLFPKGVRNFNFDKSGKFQVYLDQACNAKFENELHYEMNVSGVLSYGQIDGLSGMTAQDLFLWFPVIEIRVDIPSSGLIYFDVGVVSKKFSLSLFETPRDCLAVPSSDLQNEKNTLQTVSKSAQFNCMGGTKGNTEIFLGQGDRGDGDTHDIQYEESGEECGISEENDSQFGRVRSRGS